MQVILKNIALRYFLFLKLNKETKSGSNYFYIYKKKKKNQPMLLLGSFAMIFGSENITKVCGKEHFNRTCSFKKTMHIISWRNDQIPKGPSGGRLIRHFTSSQRTALKNKGKQL